MSMQRRGHRPLPAALFCRGFLRGLLAPVAARGGMACVCPYNHRGQDRPGPRVLSMVSAGQSDYHGK